MGAKNNPVPNCLPGDGYLDAALSGDAIGMGRRPLFERTRLSFPRYRVEEHSPDLAAFIVGFADTPPQYRSLLTRRAAHLTRVRSAAELVVIDQEREAIIVRRDVPLTLRA